ncbi:sensor histidine kinase [Halobaculum sp. D14]|uniref:sensor histidine kinase n=1 Tax=Halobaculum sp. D14 TaxID=3421642 RepID=UPI003EBE618B
MLVGAHTVPTMTTVVGWLNGGFIVGSFVGVHVAKADRQRRALATERAKAEQLAESLSVLNRVLRHDIRTDINVIQGYAALVEDRTEDGDDHLETIETRCEHVIDLADKARAAERAIRGTTGERERVDLADRVRDAVDAVATSNRDGARDAEFTVEAPDDLVVEAHPLIGYAVQQIVENAVVHNDRKPEVSVTVTETPTDAVVTVTDNGPGIPAEEVDVLLEGEETQLKHSSGLGLWMVNWIVRRCDGTLDTRSAEPRGSTVTITILRSSAD